MADNQNILEFSINEKDFSSKLKSMEKSLDNFSNNLLKFEKQLNNVKIGDNFNKISSNIINASNKINNTLYNTNKNFSLLDKNIGNVSKNFTKNFDGQGFKKVDNNFNTMSTNISKSLKYSNKEFEKFDKNLYSMSYGINKNLSKTNSEFKNLDNTINTSVVTSLDKLNNKFTVLGMTGVKIISNISDQLVYMTMNLAKSMTGFENMYNAMGKYERKNIAIRTIMNSILDNQVPKEYAKKIDYVTDSLSKLETFSDETSYDFTQMTQSIGKFVALGNSLEQAASTVLGMANWASLVGKSASEFESLSYTMEKVAGLGYVGLQQYQSLSTFMDPQTKQNILDAAVALGTLKKSAKDTYTTLSGKEVSLQSFSTNLKEKWLTMGVLNNVMGKYSKFSEAVIEYMDQTGATASEAIKKLEKQYDSVSVTAFKSAQEAKTFGEAIQSVQVAVTTGWAKSFEYIFGNVEEASKSFTDLANQLYEIFASGKYTRNAVLKIWKGGNSQNVFNDYFKENNAYLTYLNNIKKEMDKNNVTFEKAGEIVNKILEPSDELLEKFNSDLNETKDISKLILKNNFDEYIKELSTEIDNYGITLEQAQERVGKKLNKDGDKLFDPEMIKTFNEEIKNTDLSEMIKINSKNGRQNLMNAILGDTSDYANYIRAIKDEIDEGLSLDEARKKLEKNFDPLIIKKFNRELAYTGSIDTIFDNLDYGLINSLSDIINTIKESINEVFGLLNDDASEENIEGVKSFAKNLINLSIQFKEFTNSLKPTEDFLNKLSILIKSSFEIIKRIGTAYIVVLKELASLIPNIISYMFDFSVVLSSRVYFVIKSLDELFIQFINILKNKFIPIFDLIKNAFTSLGNNIMELAKNIVYLIHPLSYILSALTTLVTEFNTNDFLSKIFNLLKDIKPILNYFISLIKSVTITFAYLFKTLFNEFKNSSSSILNIVYLLNDLLRPIIFVLINGIKTFGKTIKTAMMSLNSLVIPIKNLLKTIINGFETILKNTKGNTFINFLKKIINYINLWASLIVHSFNKILNDGNINKIIKIFTHVFDIIKIAFNEISNIITKSKLKNSLNKFFNNIINAISIFKFKFYRTDFSKVIGKNLDNIILALENFKKKIDKNGFLNTLKKIFNDIISFGNNLIKKFILFSDNLISKIIDFINNFINLISSKNLSKIILETFENMKKSVLIIKTTIEIILIALKETIDIIKKSNLFKSLMIYFEKLKLYFKGENFNEILGKFLDSILKPLLAFKKEIEENGFYNTLFKKLKQIPENLKKFFKEIDLVSKIKSVPLFEKIFLNIESGINNFKINFDKLTLTNFNISKNMSKTLTNSLNKEINSVNINSDKINLTIKDKVKNFFLNLAHYITHIDYKQLIKSALKNAVKIIITAANIIIETLIFLFDSINEIVTSEDFNNSIGKLFNNFGKMLGSIYNVLKNTIFVLLSNISNILKGLIEKSDSIMVSVGIIFSSLALREFAYSLETFSNFTDALRLQMLSKVITAYKEILKTITSLIMTIGLLSIINPKAAKTSLISMAAIIGALIFLTKQIGKINIKEISKLDPQAITKFIGNTVFTLLALSAFSLIISNSIKNLANSLAKNPLETIFAFTAIVGGLAFLFQNFEKINKFSSAIAPTEQMFSKMPSLVLSFVAFAGTLAFIALIKPEDLLKASIAILVTFGLMNLITAGMNALGIVKQMTTPFKNIMDVCLSLLNIALSIKYLAAIPWDQYGVALTKLAIALLIFSGIVAIINKISGKVQNDEKGGILSKLFGQGTWMKGTYTDIFKLSVAMTMFANALRVMTKLNLTSLIGIVGFVGSIILLSKFVDGKNFSNVSKNMLAFAGAISTVSLSLALLSAINWKKLAAAAGILFLFINGTTILTSLFSGGIANLVKSLTGIKPVISLVMLIAVSFTALAGTIIIIVAAIQELSKITNGIPIFIGMIIGITVALAGIIAVMNIFSKPILNGSKTLIVFSIAVISLSVAIYALTSALIHLQECFSKLFNKNSNINKVSENVAASSKTIAESSKNIEKQSEKQGESGILGFIKGINSKSGDIKESILNFGSNISNTMTGIDFKSMFGGFADSSIEGYADVMSYGGQNIKKPMMNLADEIEKAFAKDGLGINSPSKVFQNIAEFCLQGFIKGISNDKELQYVMKDISKNTIAGTIVKTLQIGSPSKLTYKFGQWTLEGYIKGISSMKPKLEEGLFEIQKATKDALDLRKQEKELEKAGVGKVFNDFMEKDIARSKKLSNKLLVPYVEKINSLKYTKSSTKESMLDTIIGNSETIQSTIDRIDKLKKKMSEIEKENLKLNSNKKSFEWEKYNDIKNNLDAMEKTFIDLQKKSMQIVNDMDLSSDQKDKKLKELRDYYDKAVSYAKDSNKQIEKDRLKEVKKSIKNLESNISSYNADKTFGNELIKNEPLKNLLNNIFTTKKNIESLTNVLNGVSTFSSPYVTNYDKVMKTDPNPNYINEYDLIDKTINSFKEKLSEFSYTEKQLLLFQKDKNNLEKNLKQYELEKENHLKNTNKKITDTINSINKFYNDNDSLKKKEKELNKVEHYYTDFGTGLNSARMDINISKYTEKQQILLRRQYDKMININNEKINSLLQSYKVMQSELAYLDNDSVNENSAELIFQNNKKKFTKENIELLNKYKKDYGSYSTYDFNITEGMSEEEINNINKAKLIYRQMTEDNKELNALLDERNTLIAYSIDEMEELADKTRIEPPKEYEKYEKAVASRIDYIIAANRLFALKGAFNGSNPNLINNLSEDQKDVLELVNQFRMSLYKGLNVDDLLKQGFNYKEITTILATANTLKQQIMEEENELDERKNKEIDNLNKLEAKYKKAEADYNAFINARGDETSPKFFKIAEDYRLAKNEYLDAKETFDNNEFNIVGPEESRSYDEREKKITELQKKSEYYNEIVNSGIDKTSKKYLGALNSLYGIDKEITELKNKQDEYNKKVNEMKIEENAQQFLLTHTITNGSFEEQLQAELDKYDTEAAADTFNSVINSLSEGKEDLKKVILYFWSEQGDDKDIQEAKRKALGLLGSENIIDKQMLNAILSSDFEVEATEENKDDGSKSNKIRLKSNLEREANIEKAKEDNIKEREKAHKAFIKSYKKQILEEKKLKKELDEQNAQTLSSMSNTEATNLLDFNTIMDNLADNYEKTDADFNDYLENLDENISAEDKLHARRLKALEKFQAEFKVNSGFSFDTTGNTKFEEKTSETNVKQRFRNLESMKQGYEAFKKKIEKLAQTGISDEFLKQLWTGGPQSDLWASVRDLSDSDVEKYGQYMSYANGLSEDDEFFQKLILNRVNKRIAKSNSTSTSQNKGTSSKTADQSKTTGSASTNNTTQNVDVNVDYSKQTKPVDVNIAQDQTGIAKSVQGMSGTQEVQQPKELSTLEKLYAHKDHVNSQLTAKQSELKNIQSGIETESDETRADALVKKSEAIKKDIEELNKQLKLTNDTIDIAKVNDEQTAEQDNKNSKKDQQLETKGNDTASGIKTYTDYMLKKEKKKDEDTNDPSSSAVTTGEHDQMGAGVGTLPVENKQGVIYAPGSEEADHTLKKSNNYKLKALFKTYGSEFGNDFDRFKEAILDEFEESEISEFYNLNRDKQSKKDGLKKDQQAKFDLFDDRLLSSVNEISEEIQNGEDDNTDYQDDGKFRNSSFKKPGTYEETPTTAYADGNNQYDPRMGGKAQVQSFTGTQVQDGLTETTDSITNIKNELVSGLQTVMSGVAAQMTTDMNSSLEDMTNTLRDLFNNLAQTMYNAMLEIGSLASQGLSDGIEHGAGDVTDAAESLGPAAAMACAEGFDERSPSRLFWKVGSLATQGLANGITDTEGEAVKSVSNLADNLTNSLSTAMSQIGNISESDLDNEFSITPVLDLSDLNSKASSLYTSFANEQISGIQSARASQNGGNNSNNAAQQVTNTYNFNQTNNSPKSLTTTEIYRQSKNIFSQLKGAVDNV